MTPPQSPLLLGADRDDRSPITLEARHLLRHMMALGSSGSGKTVLCKAVVEEFVRLGIPAICVDPQGDICSLALNLDSPETLADKGIDPVRAREFAERAEVVVFTPASRIGVPLCADPIEGGLEELPDEERIFAIGGMAAVLTSLLGYKMESNDGQGISAVFEQALDEMGKLWRFPDDLAAFTKGFEELLASAERERFERLVTAEALDGAQRKLARLDVGARRLLFHQGLPLDIDLLLGLGEGASGQPGRTRVSVIYLNSLTSQADKNFFVAALADRLYRWMLKHPSSEPQALFYIDEVAPFIPPVRAPVSKAGLAMIFKQARKYGVCCLMATQNPGDVDYKAMAQFGTWAVGRLTTQQDIRKVEPSLKSLDPVNVDRLVESLPSLTPGCFCLLSPDAFDHSRFLKTRWLYSRHETLNEEQIGVLYRERWTRFSGLEPVEQLPRATPSPAASPAALTPPPLPEGAGLSAPEAAADSTEPDGETLQLADQLARSCSMNAKEYADLLGLGEEKARAILKRLVAAGLARSYKEGNSLRYWSVQNGLRPDLGLCRKVEALIPRITRQQAEALAEEARSSGALFGLLGGEEQVGEISLEYQVCLRLRFREKAATGFLGKLLRGKQEAPQKRRAAGERQRQAAWEQATAGLYEERADSVYLHPHTLHILTYSADGGIQLEERPEEQASDIEDFDAQATEERLPGESIIDERDWLERRPDAAIRKQFEASYHAEAENGAVEPLLIPVWRIRLERGNGQSRIHTVDALSGKPLHW